MLLVRTEGVLVEPLGDSWVAYCGRTGETHLLNTAAAALLECLSTTKPTHVDEVIGQLAAASDAPVGEVSVACATAWQSLLQAGMVQRRGTGLNDIGTGTL